MSEEIKERDWFIDLSDGSLIQVIEILPNKPYPYIVETPAKDKRCYGPEHFNHEHLRISEENTRFLNEFYNEDWPEPTVDSEVI